MVIGIFNNKGGVGKTTAVLNLAYEYAKTGKRVCVVDMDGQANTTNFLADTIDGAKLLSDIINEGENFNPEQDIISTLYDNISLMPATSDNNDFTDYYCNGGWGDFDTFIDKVVAVKNNLNAAFDVVIVDYPPTFNDVIKAFLVCLNDLTILPVILSDGRSIQALENIVEFVSERGINTQILINRFENKATERNLMQEWREMGLPMFETVIPQTGYIKQADNTNRFLSDKFKNVKNDKISIFANLMNEIG